MRTLRVFLMGMVIPLLAASLSVAVVAQDEPDPMAPAYFTATTEVVEESPRGEEAVVRDHQQVLMVEATDPRASGRMTTSMNWNTTVVADEMRILTAATTARLVNEGGTWTGAGRTVLVGGEIRMMTTMGVLTGEGGYEGLILVTGEFSNMDTMTDWGVILPSDQVPPMPDPVELPADWRHRAASAACGWSPRTRPPTDHDPTTYHAQRREPVQAWTPTRRASAPARAEPHRHRGGALRTASRWREHSCVHDLRPLHRLPAPWLHVMQEREAMTHGPSSGHLGRAKRLADSARTV